jgi:transcriptional regulator with PAS, ATPase and Fis domain
MIKEVKSNNFREDLYYRLNVFPIKTFDLRNRVDDILPITVSMIKKHFKDIENFPYLTKEAQSCLLKYGWAGNVRELENVILRASVLSNSGNIDQKHIIVDESVQNDNKYYQELEDKLAAIGN